MTGYEREVEIIICDNASNDDTEDSVSLFLESYPWIRYHRNIENIGGERNFRRAATLAQGENVWIFGDDDIMGVQAVGRVLDSIQAGYALTICNYSVWNKDLTLRLRECGILGRTDLTFENPNMVMEQYGLHLGYISAVIINKALFLKLPIEDYEPFVEYGFPFMYSVYTGIIGQPCKTKFIADPVIWNRGGNSGDYDWHKLIVVGSSLILDSLLEKGYNQRNVKVAKRKILCEFVLPNILGLKSQMTNEQHHATVKLLVEYYKSYWQFWLLGFPKLLIPTFALVLIKRMRTFSVKFSKLIRE